MKDPAPERKTRPQGRAYRRNLAGFALGAALLCLLITFYGILPVAYAESRAHPGRKAVCCADPADWGLEFEQVSVSSAGGVLRGWYLPSRNGAALILAHGIGGNRISVLEQGVFLAQNGYGALLLDLRAHGESGGGTVTFGGEDVRAAAEWLRRRADVSGKIGAAPNVCADTPSAPAWVIRGVLLWRRRALGYAGGLGLLFSLSMLFVGLIALLLLRPLMTAAPFAPADAIVVAVMGLAAFIPFALFLRGVMKQSKRTVHPSS